MQSNHPGSYARHTYRAGRMSTGQSYVSLPWQHRKLYKLTAFRRCVVDINGHDILKRVYNRSFKAPTLTSCRGGNRQVKVMDGDRVRRLTPMEYRRLQTIPDWVQMPVANSHIYNMLGDGWTIKTIEFILSSLVQK